MVQKFRMPKYANIWQSNANGDKGELLMEAQMGGRRKVGGNLLVRTVGLKEIKLDSITEIGRDAFEGCTGLTSIKIPKSVTKIEKGTFKSCRGLVEVIIPDSVEFVGDYAFIDSALKSVTVPNPDTIVSKEAFDDHVDVIITNSRGAALNDRETGIYFNRQMLAKNKAKISKFIAVLPKSGFIAAPEDCLRRPQVFICRMR